MLKDTFKVNLNFMFRLDAFSNISHCIDAYRIKKKNLKSEIFRFGMKDAQLVIFFS
jgi:hypothetical protein